MSVPTKCAQCGNLAFQGGTVTVSHDEYLELVQLRNAREAANIQISQLRLNSHSKVARDPDMAKFIVRCAETMIIKDVVTACIERFGAQRAPSKSSVHRFLQSLR